MKNLRQIHEYFASKLEIDTSNSFLNLQGEAFDPSYFGEPNYQDLVIQVPRPHHTIVEQLHIPMFFQLVDILKYIKY